MNRNEGKTNRLHPKTNMGKDQFTQPSYGHEGMTRTKREMKTDRLSDASSWSSKAASSTLTWWRVTHRLRIFLFGIFVGVFMLHLFTSIHSSTSVVNKAHSTNLELSANSKLNFLQSSHNSTSMRRSRQTQPEKTLPSGLAVSTLNDSVVTNGQERAQPTKKAIVDFERQPNVVIATKIHGPPHMKQLIQSMCLLKVAYNNRPKYDVVVFVTLPISTLEESILRDMVHPANLEIVVDKKTLNDHIKSMTTDQVEYLVHRCKVNSTEDIFWWTRCCEVGSRGACMPLAYSWQSEFRSLHIWESEALKPYKYMMWFDSDAMPTKVWQQDPVAFLIRNDLKMLFDNFPQGRGDGEELHSKLMRAYNDTICKLKLVNGHLHTFGSNCNVSVVSHIHGFFHVTDLDFYRNDENLQWSRIMIGDNKFSRRWDDQLAVTVPAAMRAPDKSWDMNYHNITLDVYHNSLIDGKRRWRMKDGKVGGGYQKWFKEHAADQFPQAVDACQEFIRNSG